MIDCDTINHLSRFSVYYKQILQQNIYTSYLNSTLILQTNYANLHLTSQLINRLIARDAWPKLSSKPILWLVAFR